MRRRGFTLVELLVVIGIIALLISILLPSLSRVKESGKRISCMSNLRQLGMAYFAYENDSKGRFPATAGGWYSTRRQEDWIWWWPQADPKTYGGAIAKYIGVFNRKLFICPSDIPDAHKQYFDGPYPFSYVMNRNMGCDIFPDLRVTKVRNSYERILLAEEEFATINDAHWWPGHVDMSLPPPYWWINGVDLLSIRHEPQTGRKQDVPGPTLPNPTKRGNVCFVDGHAEFVPRQYAHTREHAWFN